MEIILKNCNSIESGQIELRENELNIKYAINGTGKSTIAKAINSKVHDLQNAQNSLQQLKPFKYVGKDEGETEISGCESLSSVKIFNESYINDIVFQPNELIKGSFDIFIKDDKYQQGLEEIEQLTNEIRDTFNNNADIEELISDLTELSNSFGRNTASGIHGSSVMAKALKNGNKVENVPEELKEFKTYIQHGENWKWIKWQKDGKDFINITDNCPYCITDIQTKKAKIEKLNEVYDSKSIENLNKIISTFSNLNQYFSDDTKVMIDSFIKNISGYTQDQVDYLRSVKDQIDRLNDKFYKIKLLSFRTLKDTTKIIEDLEGYKINLGLFPHLNSEKSVEKTGVINSSIDKIIDKAGLLKGKVTLQRKYLNELINKNKVGINSFLSNAGYSYNVDLIESDNGEHQLKLMHNDLDSEVKDVKDHLSFGERNAFALVLFMYDVLRGNPDLVILDDPISSFDKNKKYAIIDMLFRKKESLKDKTVLFLTHDFEPIVDMVHHHRDRFTIPFAAFLENKNGILSETAIERSDVQTFIEINVSNISLNTEPIRKAVYLRRLYEVTNNANAEYDIISSLLHKREKPTKKEGNNQIVLSYDEIVKGNTEIQRHISNFNYDETRARICDDSIMKELYNSSDNNYEKLHIYRMIFDDKEVKGDNDIINKFINQAFHIENDFIYQLNPKKFQLVPQYVINECDRVIAEQLV